MQTYRVREHDKNATREIRTTKSTKQIKTKESKMRQDTSDTSIKNTHVLRSTTMVRFLIHHVGTHMNTRRLGTWYVFGQEGCDLWISSKRTLKPSKTSSPLGIHPNNLMPYKIVLRYVWDQSRTIKHRTLNTQHPMRVPGAPVVYIEYDVHPRPLFS